MLREHRRDSSGNQEKLLEKMTFELADTLKLSRICEVAKNITTERRICAEI